MIRLRRVIALRATGVFRAGAGFVSQDASVLAALVLAGLVVAAGLSGRYGETGALALAAMCVAWFVVNGPMEGPVLVVVTRGHGLTGGDLAGLAGLGIAAVQGVRARRGRQQA